MEIGQCCGVLIVGICFVFVCGETRWSSRSGQTRSGGQSFLLFLGRSYNRMLGIKIVIAPQLKIILIYITTSTENRNHLDSMVKGLKLSLSSGIV
jgi:hypothetical protein